MKPGWNRSATAFGSLVFAEEAIPLREEAFALAADDAPDRAPLRVAEPCGARFRDGVEPPLGVPFAFADVDVRRLVPVAREE